LLHPKRKYFRNIWNYKGWQNHEGFKLIPKPSQFWRIFTDNNIVVPQLKSRVFEAAFSRSLILCKRDQFNVIEKYFEPNKEFIYYENDLEDKIKEVLSNYQDYEQIIENAFQRAEKNYTTKAFVNNYLKKIF
jgi:spore maturation protein CgeB